MGLGVREGRGLCPLTQPVNGRWGWNLGGLHSKAHILKPLLERLDGHIGSTTLATEWRTGVAQVGAYNMALEKNRSMKRKRSRGTEKKNVQLASLQVHSTTKWLLKKGSRK